MINNYCCHVYSHHDQVSKCEAYNETSIGCVTPPLTGLQPEDGDGLNYTIVMDNAPGPDLSRNKLRLHVLPNPGNFILNTTSLVQSGEDGEIPTLVISVRKLACPYEYTVWS